MKTISTPTRAVLGLLAILLTFNSYSQTTIISYGSTWKYRDLGLLPPNAPGATTWKEMTHSDGAWASGPSELGYGDAPATTVSYGPDANNKYITTYFRKVVNVTNPASYFNFTLNVRRDDGIVVYINGTERVRDNMPGGAIANGTLASGAAGDDGATPQAFTLNSAWFVNGNNIIAVEVHQNAVNSTDLTFDLELLANSAPMNLINFGTSWKYLDNNTRPANWHTVGFADGGWSTGNAELGYGDAPATTVSYGADANNKYITTYFRKTFNITGVNTINSLTLRAIRDDGMVVYVNGVEVVRENMPGGTIAHGTLAPGSISGTDETTPVTFSLPRCSFVEGTNTIAVEMHQDAINSSDLSFDLELIGLTGSGTPTLNRGPYLQSASETAITVRWRTNVACLGRIRIGTSHGTYTTATASETCPTTDHIVNVTGLTADTKYWYEVGATDGTVFEAGTANFFVTNPPANTTRKIRITAFGDCGRGNVSYQDNNLSNYLNFLSTNGIEAPDAWILMGDNAYSSGTDVEYTNNFFGIYGPNIMKNHKLYPAPGNHDYGNDASNKASRTMPYHNNFTVPQSGEAGGVASNRQNFYSYNVGNIHFLSLDAYGIEPDGTDMGSSAATTALKTWLTADLAANTRKWVIAYWHHPPYTKSSHNSDSEGDLIAIRQNFITFLETRGVDLIICGHSHAYERGYLLRNFTGAWTSFSAPTHAVSTSSAAYTSAATCPYVYNTTPANHGTVYVVAGSVGASGGTNAGFGANAFPYSVNDAGIFYFEVEDNRLDAKMLRQNGTIFDRFTIMKDVNKVNNYSISNGSSQLLTASWPATTYTWSASATTTRSRTVSPPANATTNYTVTDNFGCVTDQFNVTTSVILPVSLLNFEAKLIDGKTNLKWTTSTETNNDFFTIERSANGSDYTILGTVNGAGNSSDSRTYSYVDPFPLPGTSFYRLSQTNFDVHREYLGVRRIDNAGLTDFYVKTLSGTPGKMVLQIQSSVQASYQLRIFDMSGRTIKTELLNLQAGSMRKEIALLPGMYIWEIKNDKGDAMLQKVLVQ